MVGTKTASRLPPISPVAKYRIQTRLSFGDVRVMGSGTLCTQVQEVPELDICATAGIRNWVRELSGLIARPLRCQSMGDAADVF